MSRPPPLVDAVDAVLPQTQCTRCGYEDCRAYAVAIAGEGAPIDRCPPGGAEGIVRLARVTGRPVVPLDPAHGTEGPRRLAIIDEDWCIGCTLCLKACPVDCIVGGPKLMHTIVESQCTGCELCVPACPVDCISMVVASGTRTGWAAWSAEQAAESRERHAFRRFRLERDERERRERLAARASRAAPDSAGPDTASPRALEPHTAGPTTPQPALVDDKQAVIAAALARARERRGR